MIFNKYSIYILCFSQCSASVAVFWIITNYKRKTMRKQEEEEEEEENEEEGGEI